MCTTLTKSLAQILSRDNGSCDVVARRKGHWKTLTLTLTATLPLTLTLTPALTLTQTVNNEIPISQAGHVTKQFFAHNFSGKPFYPRHVGWFGISEQKYIDSLQFKFVRTLIQNILTIFGQVI